MSAVAEYRHGIITRDELRMSYDLENWDGAYGNDDGEDDEDEGFE